MKLLFLLLIATSAWADAYKCADNTFSDQPCNGPTLKRYGSDPQIGFPTNWVKQAADRRALAEKKAQIEQCQVELDDLQWRLEQVAEYRPTINAAVLYEAKQAQLMSLQVKIDAKKRECEGLR